MNNMNIVKAFVLVVVLLGLVTTFFLSEYVSAILIGSAYNTMNPTYQNVRVYSDPFQGNDTVAQSLSQQNITEGTMRIYNGSGYEIGLDNFTINYPGGTVLVKTEA